MITDSIFIQQLYDMIYVLYGLSLQLYYGLWMFMVRSWKEN